VIMAWNTYMTVRDAKPVAARIPATVHA
jgi:hypothetical protein